MNRCVHYLCNLSREADEFELCQFPAATTKCKYILDVVKKLPNVSKVNLLSVAQTKSRKWKIVFASKFQYDDKEQDFRMLSVGSPLKIIRAVNMPILFFSILWYLLRNVDKDDVVIVYHSCAYLTAVRLAQKIRKINLILEMEEIYADVTGETKLREKELSFSKLADAFIFPTQLLDETVNSNYRNAIVIHGTYEIEKIKCEKVWDDNKVHVVYAGTLDPRKGGAAAAAKAAKFLPKNYHIHILGFGSKEQVENIQNVIRQNTDEKSATVSYDGLLSGEKYICFLQNCDIGLSTQDPTAAFNKTSFPSKILSYMANGLRVVSVNIEAVKKSTVGDLITYYNRQAPEEIANAIKNVDMSVPYDSRQRLIELNQKFQNEMEKLIEDISHEF